MQGKELTPIPTRVAHAGWDDCRHFGFSLFHELLGRETYTSLMVLAVTGKRIGQDDCAVLDDLSVIITSSDARIWPLKAIRLAASYGGILPGCAAASLCLNGDFVGPWLSSKAAENLVELALALDSEVHVGDFKTQALSLLEKKKRLHGFGVPFRTRDERLLALGRCLEKRQRAEGKYWKLLQALAAVLRAERGLEPNIASGVAAVLLDLGFETRHISPLNIAITQNVFFAHAIEGATQDAPAMRCLPFECIAYVGPPARISPRAQAKRNSLVSSHDEP